MDFRCCNDPVPDCINRVDLIPVANTTIDDGAAQFKFIYLDHETHKPVEVNGYYTFNDIDWGQSIGLTSDVWSHIDHMYVPTNKTILQYLKTDAGAFVFEPESSVGTGDDDPTSQVTFLYSGITGMDMLFTSAGDARTHLANSTRHRPWITVSRSHWVA